MTRPALLLAVATCVFALRPALGHAQTITSQTFRADFGKPQVHGITHERPSAPVHMHDPAHLPVAPARHRTVHSSPYFTNALAQAAAANCEQRRVTARHQLAGSPGTQWPSTTATVRVAATPCRR